MRVASSRSCASRNSSAVTGHSSAGSETLPCSPRTELSGVRMRGSSLWPSALTRCAHSTTSDAVRWRSSGVGTGGLCRKIMTNVFIASPGFSCDGNCACIPLAMTANIAVQRNTRQGFCGEAALRSSTNILLIPLRYGREQSPELYKFGTSKSTANRRQLLSRKRLLPRKKTLAAGR